MINFDGASALVLGLGESGLAMAQWLTREGARICVADTRQAPPAASQLLRTVPEARLVRGAFSEQLLDGIDFVALSPGLSRREPLLQTALARGLPVLGEIELFAIGLERHGMREGSSLIAITGTNGKTTVTSMVGALGRAAGLETAVAGNISPAALSALMACIDASRVPQVWALELSSFQLESVSALNADAATVLNISDDHLDRHVDLNDYAAMKARIFEGRGVQVLNRADARVMAMARPGRRQLSFGLDVPAGPDEIGIVELRGERWLAEGDTRLMPAAMLQVAGEHNIANALAALALARAVGVPAAPLVDGLRGFKGLPHRVEWVAQVEGVVFFDDSKATNVGATVAALAGLGRKVVVILGGDGKGQDFSPLVPAIAQHARAVVLIGRDAELIAAAVGASGVPLVRAATLPAAVDAAFGETRRGDAVLLSPACASWDMFDGYAHRARVFVEAVTRLAEARERLP